MFTKQISKDEKKRLHEKLISSRYNMTAVDVDSDKTDYYKVCDSKKTCATDMACYLKNILLILLVTVLDSVVVSTLD